MTPYFKAYWNPYDVSKACPTLEQDLCYSATDRITNLLDQKTLRRKLGVPDFVPAYEGCNNKVRSAFTHCL